MVQPRVAEVSDVFVDFPWTFSLDITKETIKIGQATDALQRYLSVLKTLSAAWDHCISRDTDTENSNTLLCSLPHITGLLLKDVFGMCG